MLLKPGVMTGDTVCQYLRSISFFHLLCILFFGKFSLEAAAAVLFPLFFQFSIFSVFFSVESFFLSWAGAVLFPLYRPIRETNGGKRFFTARAPC